MRNFFNTIKGFIGLQSEIKNNFFDVSTYFDKKLNETKLLSMIQKLYQNLKQKKVDEKELSIYIEFSRKILNYQMH
jgi:regulator of sirC expression with transglutaminase-like and TPR domain